MISPETTLRLAVFLSVFLVVGAWERLAPRRALRTSRAQRWVANLSLMALNTGLLRVLIPVAAVGAAVWAERRGVGLFQIVALPRVVEVVLSVVLLDLAIYVQHVVFHAMPPLWRLHRMHHADVDLDVTSGTRFHPIEMVLSMGIKMAVVVFLGTPAVAVVSFEVILNGMAMFNHGNIRLPDGVDRWARWLVVTPDVHRIHHSVHVDETNTNFGFNLSIWDRVFGTFREQPRDGHLGTTLGLPEYLGETKQTLGWLLGVPFRSVARGAAGAEEHGERGVGVGGAAAAAGGAGQAALDAVDVGDHGLVEVEVQHAPVGVAGVDRSGAVGEAGGAVV